MQRSGTLGVNDQAGCNSGAETRMISGVLGFDLE
jgi:hypothetical protein